MSISFRKDCQPRTTKLCIRSEEPKRKKFQERLTNLQTGNPRKLTVIKSYLVTDCKSGENVAHAAVQEKYPCPFGGGTEWFMVLK